MLRDALRSLRRFPAFTAVAIACLALGLGANTALFSVLNALVLRPLPFRDVAQLVDVSEDHPTELCAGCAVGTSFGTFRAWRAAARSFTGLEAYQEQPVTLGHRDAVERVSGALVSGGLLDLLGVPPLLGRLLQPADDLPGAAPVAVLGQRLWESRFGADSAVLNSTITLNGVPHQVVGIMPARFGFPEFARVWTPFAGQRDRQPAEDRSLGVVGRLRPGVSRTEASAEMASIAAGLASQQPATHRGWTARVLPLERPLADTGANTGVALGLAAAGFVLLITCANLANLFLARGAARRREFAIRAAVGAARRTLIRENLAESLLLATAGGALGLLVGQWAIEGLLLVIGTEIPVWVDLSFDWRVFLFAAALALVTSVAFGLAPALDAGRTDVQAALRAGGHASTGSRGESRLRSGLVVVQVSLALALLTGTALVVTAFSSMNRPDADAADPRLVLRGDLQLVEARYEDPAAVRALGLGLAERLTAIPGVSASAVTHTEFLGAFVGTSSRVFLDGSEEALPAAAAPRFALAVTPGYFATAGLTVARGRGIGAEDHAGAPRVAVVNAAAAALLWPGGEPLGQRFRVGDGPASREFTVVGVTDDVRNTITRRPTPLLYTALAQGAARPLALELRSDTDPRALMPAVRAAVIGLDPHQPIDNLMTGAEFRAMAIAPVRFMSAIMGTLGVLALLLAGFGLYSTLAFLVARSTRELGIRMALGAVPGDLMRLVLGRAGVLVAVATVIGIPLAYAVARLVRAAVFGVGAGSPSLYAAAPAVLGLVALVAAYLPARRAVRSDPLLALRAE